MQSLTEHQLLIALLALALILIVGRGTAELARRIGQPEVLGELIGGFILGPSIFGALWPELRHGLFSDVGVTLPLSIFSWTGAILLLMLAGAEVDLSVLSKHFKAGLALAVFVIIPSIGAGTIFGVGLMHESITSGIFLGAVISVTAVSVIAKIFIESQTMRRSYAQVILAAGIASEVAIWPIISALAPANTGEPLSTGLLTAGYAILFFAIMLTVGQNFTDWAMRRIADMTQIIYGQLSLIIILGFLFACATQTLGLHALLGPFIFGLLIGRAPRTTARVKENLQALTMSIFAPVFFVTAGMRVDITKISDSRTVLLIIGLFALATFTKLFFGYIGGRVGGLKNWESLLVGLGTNMKGGTDVVIAILGCELGLLDEHVYSIYTIVAILTVMLTPPLIKYVAQKVPPSDAESERLIKEEAKSRAYFSTIERVMLPTYSSLLPIDCVPVLKSIASAKEIQNEIFDIMELAPDDKLEPQLEAASEELRQAGESTKVEYVKTTSKADPVESVIAAANQCDLLMMGASRPTESSLLTLGQMQDKIIDSSQTDVFVMIDGNRLLSRRVKRILVPINGLEHSMAAADIAAYIAKANEAEVVLFTVIHHDQPVNQQKLGYHRIRRAGAKILKEAKFRTKRIDIICRETIVISEDVNKAIISELKSRHYDLVVLGAVDRSGDTGIYLGKCIQAVLTQTKTPAGILVLHPRAAA